MGSWWYLENFATSSISRERFKLENSNLARILAIRGTNEKNTKFGQRGSWWGQRYTVWHWADTRSIECISCFFVHATMRLRTFRFRKISRGWRGDTPKPHAGGYTPASSTRHEFSDPCVYVCEGVCVCVLTRVAQIITAALIGSHRTARHCWPTRRSRQSTSAKSMARLLGRHVGWQ